MRRADLAIDVGPAQVVRVSAIDEDQHRDGSARHLVVVGAGVGAGVLVLRRRSGGVVGWRAPVRRDRRPAGSAWGRVTISQWWVRSASSAAARGRPRHRAPRGASGQRRAPVWDSAATGGCEWRPADSLARSWQLGATYCLRTQKQRPRKAIAAPSVSHEGAGAGRRSRRPGSEFAPPRAISRPLSDPLPASASANSRSTTCTRCPPLSASHSPSSYARRPTPTSRSDTGTSPTSRSRAGKPPTASRSPSSSGALSSSTPNTCVAADHRDPGAKPAAPVPADCHSPPSIRQTH
jgi:hypothetical protein